MTSWCGAQFAGYKSLQYLHIVPDYYDVLNLQEDIFNCPPPNLELFGYGSQMHPIGRDPATGLAIVHPRWPYPKVHFRTAGDFGNADWEWLLRHHGYDDEESCTLSTLVRHSSFRADMACSHAQCRLVPVKYAHDNEEHRIS